MQTLELDGLGEVRLQATMLTLVIYEQNFEGKDLIADLFGKQGGKDEGDQLVVDFGGENFLAVSRVAWAMAMTEWELRNDRGDATPNEKPKPYKQWMRSIGPVNLRDLSMAVVIEAVDGFFHTGAADSE